MRHERCSERAYSKARQVVACVPAQLDPALACRALVLELEERIRRWSLPPDRSIERIEPTYGDNGVWIEGYYGSTMRLLVEVRIDPQQRAASIELVATKGDLSVDVVAMGDTGPSVGNSILVALLLELGICVLRSRGVRALTNRPWNDRLREYYESMGFADGTRLDLDDERALSMAFDVIERVYASHGWAPAEEG